MLFRIGAVIILLLSVLFMPFWLSVILAVAGMFYFKIFWEAIVLFLVSDLLFGLKDAGVIFLSGIVALLAFVLIEIMKKKLKFYP